MSNIILQDICDLIQDYMDLPDGQVWIKNQKLNKHRDGSFDITVGFLSLKAFGSNCTPIIASTTTMTEKISTNMSAQVAIDIYGKTFDVVTRKEEIIQCMKSTACRELQLVKGYMIGPIPTTFVDISEIDGPAIPYRFQITFGVQFLVTKTKTIEYYDTYQMDDILTEG